VTRIVKDCFGTVISTLTKMKECVRCELLSECRSINWTAPEGEGVAPVVLRRHPPGGANADDTTQADGDAADTRH
jgi:hypothetical protein